MCFHPTSLVWTSHSSRSKYNSKVAPPNITSGTLAEDPLLCAHTQTPNRVRVTKLWPRRFGGGGWWGGAISTSCFAARGRGKPFSDNLVFSAPERSDKWTGWNADLCLANILAVECERECECGSVVDDASARRRHPHTTPGGGVLWQCCVVHPRARTVASPRVIPLTRSLARSLVATSLYSQLLTHGLFQWRIILSGVYFYYFSLMKYFYQK